MLNKVRNNGSPEMESARFQHFDKRSHVASHELHAAKAPPIHNSAEIVISVPGQALCSNAYPNKPDRMHKTALRVL